MEKIGFGVVGCGFFGGEFARILQEMEEAKVTAVLGGRGPSAREVAAQVGCELEEELEKLVSRSDVHAVVVSSPNHRHKEAVLAAARHGKHVFCEKPAALSLEDAREMVLACREAKVQLMVGHILHFFRGIEQVKSWIRSGAIGRPLVCHAERTGWEQKQDGVSWKKRQDEAGGHLFHHIHELDLVVALMGTVSSVGMMAGNLAHTGEGFGDEDDVLLVSLSFAEGGFGTLQYGSGFQWGEHYIKINGSEGGDPNRLPEFGRRMAGGWRNPSGYRAARRSGRGCGAGPLVPDAGWRRDLWRSAEASPGFSAHAHAEGDASLLPRHPREVYGGG